MEYQKRKQFSKREDEKKLSFWRDEQGDIGVKQIAITVGVIVIIAVAVTLIRNTFLEQWIKEVWEMFMKAIEDMMV
ncbi:hypothetical protein [Paenibacillus bouchesdurhonensis]|uniref:hypothetical protein n=1 Tax=Paenibacillus bouchesdurhonensis TaxID=1870990 RepID=UPI000DA5EDF3|nr:hypothetical protein [Paenibacillus bouchesdurhonensis]